MALPTAASPSGKTSSGYTTDSPVFTSTSTNVSTSASVTTSATAMENETAPGPQEPGSTGTASYPQTLSSGSSSSTKPLVPTTTISAPSHPVSHVPTPALAGAIAAAVLATTTAAVLFRLWMRRRRARALLSTTPNSISEMSTGDNSTSAATIPVVPSHIRTFSKIQAEEDVPGIRTHTHSIVSGSSHGARYGSATSLGPSPSCRSLLAVDADHKNRACHGQALPRPATPPIPTPPSMEHLPDGTGSSSDVRSPSDIHVAPQGIATTSSELEAAAEAPGERLLHLALPWVLGQRVLAMIGGEDAHSVGSDISEPLPAYEPRG
ncbi:hypothetical protein TRAPUB_13235 [Trametes pubescens]|uniref:Uncharacterized protein n=1 Tax=Trametes pubescens TaxID=154538 RepID=A0A1M2VRX8_TRAPU|nr:hypothetical protein TRAPUB_13235 [Trametes pubescens]